MFNLVADVESYPQFLPLCERLTLLSREERAGREILVAEMEVGYRNIRQRFVSRVILNRPEWKIDVSYMEGPFRHLENNWRFRPTGSNSCEIEFRIEYEFRSKSLGLLMGAMFDRAFRRFTTAFEERADKLYS